MSIELFNLLFFIFGLTTIRLSHSELNSEMAALFLRNACKFTLTHLTFNHVTNEDTLKIIVHIADTSSWAQWNLMERQQLFTYLTFFFICVTGFNMEDFINVPPLTGGKLVKVAQSTNETGLENPKHKACECLYPAVRWRYAGAQSWTGHGQINEAATR